ncbi:hypothetical protein QWY14_02265 [Planococcus sp. N028]|uniref:HicA family toxin-antitoxin system n=1 Tax=Planococcus shixiaomingii TaxID=3058393 RepID=A0ABT8MYQ3_9BACL|nr:hypothetical protein [Planococcus sp. N028]MDN7240592.1 hypothetical protein [Planococcus sp. N028]
MYEEKRDEPELKDFEVKPVFEERIHQRYAFTFKIEEHVFKGHFHENQIHWLHPHPKQLIGEDKIDAIESVIHSLMVQYGISTDTQELEVKPVFEDKAYKRHQFTLKVQGEQYKGFVHESEIQWFHPQPNQKLKEEQVQAIEAEIQEKFEDFKKEEDK